MARRDDLVFFYPHPKRDPSYMREHDAIGEALKAIGPLPMSIDCGGDIMRVTVSGYKAPDLKLILMDMIAGQGLRIEFEE